MFAIEAVLREILGERIEQCRIAGWVRISEVVGRIDDAATHDEGPNAVRLDFGKERVVLGSEPFHKGLTAIAGGRRVDVALARQPGLHLLSGPRLRYFAAMGHENQQ